MVFRVVNHLVESLDGIGIGFFRCPEKSQFEFAAIRFFNELRQQFFNGCVAFLYLLSSQIQPFASFLLERLSLFWLHVPNARFNASCRSFGGIASSFFCTRSRGVDKPWGGVLSEEVPGPGFSPLIIFFESIA